MVLQHVYKALNRDAVTGKHVSQNPTAMLNQVEDKVQSRQDHRSKNTNRMDGQCVERCKKDVEARKWTCGDRLMEKSCECINVVQPGQP